MKRMSFNMKNLKSKSVGELKALGFQEWELKDGRVIMLFHENDYSLIPDGVELVDILGRRMTFEKGTTSDDTRGGYLAYGIEVKTS